MKTPLSAASGLRVALYHHLSDTPSDLVDAIGVTTPPALFQAHVERLARDYEVVDLDTVLSARLPKRALLLTFDDGFRSVADVALPILDRLGLPSVLFVSAAFLDAERVPLDSLLSHLSPRAGLGALHAAIVGGDAARRAAAPPATVRELLAVVATLPYARRLALGDELADRFAVDQAALRAASNLFLDGDDLAGLAAHRCAIGNHTRTHLFCRAIVDDEGVERELVSHRAELERQAGVPVRAFSYPYGSRVDATPFVERALRESGHELSFLVEARRNAPSSAGPAYNRVSLPNRPSWQIGAELELKPVLRSLRDRLRPAEVGR